MVLCIAIGNPLRRDDGVARHVLDLLGTHRETTRRDVVQLTPELAEEIASADTVVFVDACVDAATSGLEPLRQNQRVRMPIAHSMTPGEVVSLAEGLYGFQGQAYLCRVPASDLGPGEGLSQAAEAAARDAVASLQDLILCMNHR